MTWLMVLAVLITAATVWYMARPLTRPFEADDRERRNHLQQLRDRLLTQLHELDIEEGDRNIDAGVVKDERSRLEAELAKALRELETLDAGRKKKKGKKAKQDLRRGWIIALVVFGFVLPLSAAGLYTLNQRQTLAYLLNPDVSPDGAIPPMALEMVARLEKRLAEQPDDAPGWAQLGRAYAVMNKPEAARAAYERAYKLSPDDPQVMAEYAGFLYQQEPQNTDGLVYTLFSRLQKLDPENQDALWFLGFADFQKGDYKQALGYWERLLRGLPADSNEAAHLRLIISKTHEKLGKK